MLTLTGPMSAGCTRNSARSDPVITSWPSLSANSFCHVGDVTGVAIATCGVAAAAKLCCKAANCDCALAASTLSALVAVLVVEDDGSWATAIASAEMAEDVAAAGATAAWASTAERKSASKASRRASEASAVAALALELESAFACELAATAAGVALE